MASLKPIEADGAQPTIQDLKRLRSASAGSTPASLPGTALTSGDLEGLQRAGIDPSLAKQALLRRVDSFTGAQVMGRNENGDYAGMLIPYIWPGEQEVREYRLRRDRPEMENGKPKNKYLSPPGRANMLYFVPGTDPQWLSDVSIPILLTEGEKKCLALWALGWHSCEDGAERPRWLTVATSGVNNWRGKIGKVNGSCGERLDEVGPIADLARVDWKGRSVTVMFDANVRSNDTVRIARRALAKELRARGARVFFVDIPVDAGVNGVDDLVGTWGRDRVLQLIVNYAYDSQENKATSFQPSKIEIDQIPSVRSFDSSGIEFTIENLISSVLSQRSVCKVFRPCRE